MLPEVLFLALMSLNRLKDAGPEVAFNDKKLIFQPIQN